MSKHHDQPRTEPRASGALSAVVRFGGLLMAAVLASVLWVDLPMPSGRAASGHLAEPYVPASNHWIELGAPPPADSPELAAPAQPAAPSAAARQGSVRDTKRVQAPSRAGAAGA